VRQLVLLIGLLLAACQIHASEEITRYHSTVDILADGRMDVTEHITVKAEGKAIRRGIYRDFPTRYKDRFGNRVRVDLDVHSVERDGSSEPWFTESRGNGVRINTGDDSFLDVPAEYRFTFRFTTSRQLGFFKSHDELYWNAIGTGWQFPIKSGSVEVRLPEPVEAADLQLDAYTGRQGSRDKNARVRVVEPGVVRWELTAPLDRREGMTIVLGFPKGLVSEPGRLTRIAWFFRDNLGNLVMVAGFFLLLAFCIVRWHQVGRDPLPGAIYARYEPPQDFTPAGLRLMTRYSYDDRCFSADLLHLAVGGALNIHHDGKKASSGWRLEKLDPSRVPGHIPAALPEKLFPGNASEIELKNTQAKKIQAAKGAHHKRLIKRFEPKLFNRNYPSVIVAALIAGAPAALVYFAGGGGFGLFSFGVVALMALTIFVFALVVRAPTDEGRRLLDEIEGLKLFLSVAEKDDLAALRGPGDDRMPELDAERYERLLPYAVALEVEDAWTKKFTLAVGASAAAAAAGAMAWYHGSRTANINDMTRAMSSGLTSQIASSSKPPGSSSGGGGGGFSGGGGGGGGGGGR